MTNTNNTSKTQNSRDSQDSHQSRESEEPRETEKSQSASAKGTSAAENRRPAPMEVLRQARAQLAELTGLTPDSVSSFGQTEGGWALEVEVLELERVPDTMSLMASYQVELDHEGQLTGYRRVRRYERGRADQRGGR
ncbi:gas vesicle protein [Streptomyces sp. NPDC096012]|uniref:gas vesicle protein GvpO n=1 Tax=Streptomyces sp. NPDC096012 TaxID=3155684 RepID=UPI00336A7C70